jgi:hypothetical protein
MTLIHDYFRNIQKSPRRMPRSLLILFSLLCIVAAFWIRSYGRDDAIAVVRHDAWAIESSQGYLWIERDRSEERKMPFTSSHPITRAYSDHWMFRWGYPLGAVLADPPGGSFQINSASIIEASGFTFNTTECQFMKFPLGALCLSNILAIVFLLIRGRLAVWPRKRLRA